MAFKAGQSGNPGGKPKMSEGLTKILKKGADEALLQVIKLSQKAQSDKIKLAACQYLIDRQYGKAVQPIGNDDDQPFLVKWKE